MRGGILNFPYICLGVPCTRNRPQARSTSSVQVVSTGYFIAMVCVSSPLNAEITQVGAIEISDRDGLCIITLRTIICCLFVFCTFIWFLLLSKGLNVVVIFLLGLNVCQPVWFLFSLSQIMLKNLTQRKIKIKLHIYDSEF